jgi:hypothetical protein
VPVLVVQRVEGLTRGYGAGWDLILPAGWGLPFWVSLIFAGARPIGNYQDKECEVDAIECEPLVLFFFFFFFFFFGFGVFFAVSRCKLKESTVSRLFWFNEICQGPSLKISKILVSKNLHEHSRNENRARLFPPQIGNSFA